MVNAKLCEKARLAVFFASPRHFDFFTCETEKSVLNASLSRSDVIQVHI